MKKISKLMLVGMLSAVFMFGSVMPVAAESYYDVIAKISGPNTNSKQIMLDPVCFLYGYASCEKSGTMMGHICVWKAKQTGSEPFAGTNSAASFGSDGKVDNIMEKSYMVTTYPTTLHEYEKTAEAFTAYNQTTTRLYY